MTRKLTALVIGNAAYEVVVELKNPANDAEDIGRQLEASGFTVISKTDCSNAEMERALRIPFGRGGRVRAHTRT